MSFVLSCRRDFGRLPLYLRVVSGCHQYFQFHLVVPVPPQLSALQNATYKANERLEAFKVQMNYNQEALEQWALAAKQKDEDSLALAKYMRADEERTKALTLHIERLTKESLAAKQTLENEVTETQTAQVCFLYSSFM